MCPDLIRNLAHCIRLVSVFRYLYGMVALEWVGGGGGRDRLGWTGCDVCMVCYDVAW